MKEYIKPAAEVVELIAEESILATSTKVTLYSAEDDPDYEYLDASSAY